MYFPIPKKIQYVVELPTPLCLIEEIEHDHERLQSLSNIPSSNMLWHIIHTTYFEHYRTFPVNNRMLQSIRKGHQILFSWRKTQLKHDNFATGHPNVFFRHSHQANFSLGSLKFLSGCRNFCTNSKFYFVLNMIMIVAPSNESLSITIGLSHQHMLGNP